MKLSCLLLLLLTMNSGFSQNKIVYGIKGGVNLSGFHTGKGTFNDLPGFNLGGVANKELGVVDLQLEINLNTKGGLYQAKAPSFFSQEIKLTYLNIPVQAQVNITPKFKFEAGPEFGLLLAQKASMADEDIKSVDVSMDAGLSYTFGNGIFIQGRYGHGLTRLMDHRNYKNSCISISLGYFLK